MDTPQDAEMTDAPRQPGPRRRAAVHRRGLDQLEAAAYVGVGVNKFRDLVERGLMPTPKLIDGARRWDIEALDIYFGALPEDNSGSAQRSPDRNRRLSPHTWK
jgi:hypothetical protein